MKGVFPPDLRPGPFAQHATDVRFEQEPAGRVDPARARNVYCTTCRQRCAVAPADVCANCGAATLVATSDVPLATR